MIDAGAVIEALAEQQPKGFRVLADSPMTSSFCRGFRVEWDGPTKAQTYGLIFDDPDRFYVAGDVTRALIQMILTAITNADDTAPRVSMSKITT
jgi:hypothetical protein